MSVDGRRRAAFAVLLLLGGVREAAAWQPPKAEPAPKVEACPEMGEGFVRIPGSSTCIQVGGSVRIEAMHVGSGASISPAGH